MNKCREQTLQDLCDVTPTLSQPQITPVSGGNCRMQGPECEAKYDLLTHMVTSEDSNGIGSCSDNIHKVDIRGKSETCNACSSPCFSCFDVNKVLMKSNTGSAGETSAQNIEVRQVSDVSTVAGMNSTTDSLSENAVGNGSSRTSNASASEDSVVHSKSEGQRVPECHDDCLSCVSGTDEHANRKSDMEDGRIKSNTHSRIFGESSDKVCPTSSPTGIDSQSSGLVEVPSSKNSDAACDLLKFHETNSQAFNGEYSSDYQNPRDVKNDGPDKKHELLHGSTEHLNSSSGRVAASDVVCGDPPAPALDSVEKNNNMEVEVHAFDETDDSDMVELDVKVCDICGDAGREDFLALCSRCSDGAEHTYCMREMLDKVPEGDWLCEECKTVERVGNERQAKIGRVDENEKNNSSGQASSEYINSYDVEGHRKKGHMRISRKRHGDDADAEVSSTAKKPAKPIIRSPKTSKFTKSAALSRESSSKSLDKGRLQSSHNSLSKSVYVNDTTESASSASDPRVHNFKGVFSKSNSFNSLNSKPKLKLVDQVFIQRKNSVTEHGSFHLKEGPTRSLGKSISFKSTMANRSESKIKMLSPRLSHNQDIKNTKQGRPFERERSFRSEQSSINSMISTSKSSTLRIDKREGSRGESSSLTTIPNHHEKKPVHADGKSTTLSKSSSFAARKTADLSISLGEFKRPSAHGQSATRILSANGINSVEQKSYQTSLKEDSSPHHIVVRKPSSNANEDLPDGSPCPRGLTNSGERMKNYSGSRLGPTPLKSPRSESDNLKAAIEAAVLRKPGVYWKHRAGESSVSSVGYAVAPHQDYTSSSADGKKMSPDAELTERPIVSQKLSADSLKQETLNNVKQSSLGPVEGLSSGRSGLRPGPSLKDVFSNVPLAVPLLLKSLAVPQHEYIWQGSFEICRSGKFVHSWDGIQAHLSTCASPKVVETVNKFKSRMVLYEVPRVSAWPVQFLECGVREDNIALFFFAKDLHSYDKIYKVLLDYMMKNDLALKGNVNGVELLMFPSNQLPDKLQRWNMLFFLWGVFRGKKQSSLQHMPESLNQFTAPDIPQPIMSLPENRCSSRPIGDDLFVNEEAAPMVKVPSPKAFQSLLSSRADGDCVANVSSLDQLQCRLNSSSSTAVESDAKQYQEMRGIFQGGDFSSQCSTPGALRNSSSGKEQMLMQLESLPDRRHLSQNSSKSMIGPLTEGIGEGTLLNNTCNQNQVKLRKNAGDPSMDEETPVEADRNMKDLNIHNKLPFNHEEYRRPGSCIMSKTFYTGNSQVSLKDNDRHDETYGALGKVNHVLSGSYALQNQREAYVETVVPVCAENAERHFFPIESQPVKPICLSEGSSPWKMQLSEQDGLNDRAPNLELALGDERKPSSLFLGNQPLLVSKVDLNRVYEEHIVEQGPKEEEDVSASLSLSLSFPIPEKELIPKPAPKTGQLMSGRKGVHT